MSKKSNIKTLSLMLQLSKSVKYIFNTLLRVYAQMWYKAHCAKVVLWSEVCWPSRWECFQTPRQLPCFRQNIFCPWKLKWNISTHHRILWLSVLRAGSSPPNLLVYSWVKPMVSMSVVSGDETNLVNMDLPAHDVSRVSPGVQDEEVLVSLFLVKPTQIPQKVSPFYRSPAGRPV